jgi:hypothetical protein
MCLPAGSLRLPLKPVQQTWLKEIKPYHQALADVIRQHSSNIGTLDTRSDPKPLMKPPITLFLAKKKPGLKAPPLC